MNLPRDVVGVSREDAASLVACHGDVTARGGEGGEETQLNVVTRGASVMSAPNRFHLQHKTPQLLLDTALSFPTWKFWTSPGILLRLSGFLRAPSPGDSGARCSP